MSLSFVIDGIPVRGGRDGKVEWWLTDPVWRWSNGKRPPAPNYASVCVLGTVEVHTKEKLRRDRELWLKVFADVAKNILTDAQLDAQLAARLPLVVFDGYTDDEGTPNDTALSKYAPRAPSDEMREAYDQALSAERVRREA